jgi:hypothetical protein
MWSSVLMRTSVIRQVVLTFCVAGVGPASSVFAQAQPAVPGSLPAAVQQAAAGGTQVRRLTADEAVRLAAETTSAFRSPASIRRSRI